MKHITRRPTLTILREDQIRLIHEQTLIILEEIGVQVLHDEARKILRDGGARLDDDSIVRIPHRLVERALECCPKTVTFYERGGNPWERVFTRMFV